MIKTLGITFNGKHSYNDFGLIMEYFKPQPPQPKKIIQAVPGMNGDGYDFSTVLTNGEKTFTGRDLNCKFGFKEKDKKALEQKYGAVLEWLVGSEKSKLTSDTMPGLFFMAEVQEIPQWDEVRRMGYLILDFRADPYKKGVANYGDLLWNDVDFYLPDYIQETRFTVNGSKTVTIGVPGSHSIIPKVVCSTNMTCTTNGYTTTFTSSKSLDWQFKLKPGLNNIQINGTGDIDFQFSKEVL